MKERINTYTVVDVETANRANDSICSIGLVRVVDGFIADEFYSLVNPEDYFDMGNISIHGITPNMVANAPTFGELYPELKQYLERTVIVAHNARFDLGVLRKNLLRYGIAAHEYPYACTVVLGRKAFPELKRHNLAALSHYLDISLEHHHHALDDAKAAQEIFESIQRKISLGPKQLKTYHLADESVLPLSADHLEQILAGLEEVLAQPNLIDALRLWYEDNQIFQDAYPIGNFLYLTDCILADGEISPSERQILEHWFHDMTGRLKQMRRADQKRKRP